MNPKLNYRLWEIMMCPCRFINYNKCTAWVGDIDNGGGYACVGTEAIWEISAPYSQFYCEPKNALESKVV